jgi:RNA polymerase sigma-70 factor (ECF subfamily)
MHESIRRPEGAGPSGDLIGEARNGSAEALGRLLEGCRAYLLLVANNGIGSDLRAKGGASDLVQETFLEAQLDFERFEGHTNRDLLNWLRGILRHNLADFRRRYRLRTAHQVSRERPLNAERAARLYVNHGTDTPRPDEALAAAEEEEALGRAVERLPEDYRHAIELRQHLGLSFLQIGQVMGRSPAAARKLWFRAIERLRQEMKAGHERP